MINYITDGRWKEIVQYIKDNTEDIPAGTNFYKLDESGNLISTTMEKSQRLPSFGLAYLTLIRETPYGDPKLVNDTIPLEQAAIEKIKQLEERGFTWEEIKNGEIG